MQSNRNNLITGVCQYYFLLFTEQYFWFSRYIGFYTVLSKEKQYSRDLQSKSLLVFSILLFPYLGLRICQSINTLFAHHFL